jgi:hypothetical protein
LSGSFATHAVISRHPDRASIASGRRWLLASGQLRASEAGTGFKIAPRSFDLEMAQELLRIGEKRLRNSHVLDIVISDRPNVPFLEQEDL